MKPSGQKSWRQPLPFDSLLEWLKVEEVGRSLARLVLVTSGLKPAHYALDTLLKFYGDKDIRKIDADGLRDQYA